MTRDLIEQVAKALAEHPNALGVRVLREALVSLESKGGKGFIVFRHLQTFCPYKGADGGQYAYYTRYCPCEDSWRVEYDTSADFAYCPIWGRFQDCETCPDLVWDIEGGYKCVASFEEVDDQELAEEIQRALENNYRLFLEEEEGTIKVVIESRSLCETCSQCD